MTAEMNVTDGLDATTVRNIREAWSGETSASDDWDAARPENGQCAVTALIVQDRFGGTLHRAMVNGVSHYWNRLPNGVEVDLTRAQFDSPLTIEGLITRERDYLLSSEMTVSRYEILKKNLNLVSGNN